MLENEYGIISVYVNTTNRNDNMKLKNTTNIDDRTLGQMITHACTFWRRKINAPFYKKHIREARFRNRRNACTGRAYMCSPEIVCSIGRRYWECHCGCSTLGKWCGDKSGITWHDAEQPHRLWYALHIIGHEVGHLAVHFAEKHHQRKRTRRDGKSVGGDEEFIDRMALKFRDEFANQYNAAQPLR